MNLRKIAKTGEHAWRRARMRAFAALRAFPATRAALNLPRSERVSINALTAAEGRVQGVDAAQAFERPAPLLPPGVELPWEFAEHRRGVLPRTFVAEFGGARFWGRYGGSVFTAEGRMVEELSKDVWGPLHSAYVAWRLPTLRPLRGRTLSLVTPEAEKNYHHWTMDLLPRVGLVVRAGYRLEDFDHVLMKWGRLPFQREALQRLGIDERKVIEVDDGTHLATETLVVPALRLDNTGVGRADVEFVRGLYLPVEPAPGAARRRLYLSRRDAAFRRVRNEADILPLLQRYDFEELVLSKMSVAEQAQALSGAAVVLGPHGAASANLVFAHRACRVIEFMAPGWIVPYTWTTCAHLGLPYTVLIGAGERTPRGTLPHDVKQDIVLDVAELEQVLAQLG